MESRKYGSQEIAEASESLCPREAKVQDKPTMCET